MSFYAASRLVSRRARPTQHKAFWGTTPVAVTPEKPEEKPPVRQEELVETLAEAHDLSKAKARRILDTLMDTIADSLADGKTVKLSNFGTFQASEQAARQARNPSTGEPVWVPERKRVRFAAYKGLKETVNKKK